MFGDTEDFGFDIFDDFILSIKKEKKYTWKTKEGGIVCF